MKAFLDSIANQKSSEQDPERGQKLAILRECFEQESSDLLQTWSFAAQTDNERLVTATTSNLALLLRTFSGLLDFREHGLTLARSLLQREQLKLCYRGLSAESHKENLISPCLRILTEIVSFDGGALASQVFRFQDSTFNSKFLDRNLRLYKSNGEEDRRKASVRTNTVRYILAHLRYQDVDNKISLLNIRSVFRNLVENIRNDPPEVLQDILKTIEASVLKNDEIPRKLKSSLFSERALTSVVDGVRGLPEDSEFAATAWTFLLRICTNPDLGVQLPSSWYPPSKDKSKEDLDYSRNHTETADVRNIIISKFVQHLRPHSDLRERELLISIFKATPELVADYLRQASSRLSLQPKLTNTWIGYASLMYSIIETPVPAFFGMSSYRSIPPEADVILENIIPSTLSADVLTRCLNQQSGLVTFFALRILVIALEKAKTVYENLSTAAQEYHSYEALASSLEFQVAKRLPAFKDVANTYRTLAKYDETKMSQEAAAHAMSLYRQVIPEVVTEESDVANHVASVLEVLQKPELPEEESALLELQLTHLLDLAQNSLNMQWWQRQGKLAYSPFVTILKLRLQSSSSLAAFKKLRDLMASIAYEEGVLQSSTHLSAIDALFASLEPSKHWEANLETWSFLDDCFSRLHKKPIKYLDDLDGMIGPSEKGSRITEVSLLTLVMLEQVPFTSRLTEGDRDNVLNWCSRFVKALQNIGESEKIVSMLEKQIKSQTFSRSKAKLRDIQPRQSTSSEQSETNGAQPNANLDGSKKESRNERGLQVEFQVAPKESAKHPELSRYKRLDLEEIVQDGLLDSLMLCLCSEYPEIRRQGVSALQDMMSRLETSDAEYKDQLWLLIGDLLETTASTIEDRALPYMAGSLAVASRKVLIDPTHLLFPLVNRYLLKDPYWNVSKLPDYFLRKTLLETSGEDDQFWPQIEWVLAFLVDGIRTSEDVLPLRHRNALERILLLVHSPTVTAKVTSLVLQLVHRVCSVGSSTILITNSGLDTWLAGLESLPRQISASSLEALGGVVADTTEKGRTDQWKGTRGTLESLKPKALDGVVSPTR